MVKLLLIMQLIIMALQSGLLPVTINLEPIKINLKYTPGLVKNVSIATIQ
jgi:hypothetical protein